MFQEFGLSSNIPLIIITIIVIALTILCYMESKRVSNQLELIRGKLAEAYSQINQLKKGIETNQSVKKETKNDNNLVKQKENNEVMGKVPLSEDKGQSNDDLTDQVDTNSEKNNLRDVVSEEKQMNVINADFKNISERIPIPSGHPLFAMMMQGGPLPPMGQPDLSLSQKIEEWDDNTQNNIYDEEIQDDLDEEKYDKNYDEGQEQNNEEISDNSYDEDETDDDESDEDEITVEKSNVHSGAPDETLIKNNNSDTKIISLVDNTYSVKQLQDICKTKNLSYSGNKTQLINRINGN
jgi:hypothetical protein